MMKNRAVVALLALLAGAIVSACSPGGSAWRLDQHYGYPRHTVGWSPQGHIVFSSGRSYASRSIYAVRDDGSLLSIIQESGQGRLVTNVSPEVSPDGSEIAYARYKDSEWCGLGGHNWDVFVTRIDGSHTRRLTRDKGPDSSPIWSPDGERILFSSHNCDDGNLCIMNADGSGVRALPWDYVGSNPWASWSPDGRRLALFGQPPDISPKYMLFVAMADGSNLTRIMQTEAVATPSWSPDGDYLVFVSDADRSVHVASADGEIVRKIDDLGASQALWSPNRSEILVYSGRNTRIMSPEGLLLSSWPARGLVVAWSPDGLKIAFSDEEGTVWTVNRDGTDLRVLVDSGELVSS